MNKIGVKLKKLRDTLVSLESIYLQPHREDRSNIDATIKRFEFTIELFWSVLKDYFYLQGMDIKYPKNIIKEAYAGDIIHDEATWVDMLNDRNHTSHTYDKGLSDKIFLNIRSYVPILRISF